MSDMDCMETRNLLVLVIREGDLLSSKVRDGREVEVGNFYMVDPSGRLHVGTGWHGDASAHCRGRIPRFGQLSALQYGIIYEVLAFDWMIALV